MRSLLLISLYQQSPWSVWSVINVTARSYYLVFLPLGTQYGAAWNLMKRKMLLNKVPYQFLPVPQAHFYNTYHSVQLFEIWSISYIAISVNMRLTAILGCCWTKPICTRHKSSTTLSPSLNSAPVAVHLSRLYQTVRCRSSLSQRPFMMCYALKTCV